MIADSIKVMLVDDELSMQTLVGQIALDAGLSFTCVGSGSELLETWQVQSPDVILLDVMMPRLDGFEACRRLRASGCETPVIFLTAKGDIVDKSTGFNAGGDDYVVKPFNSEELVLRIEAVVRRSHNAATAATATNVVRIDDLELDAKRHRAIVRGRQVEMTPKEFHLLFLLASHPGEVFTKEQLVESVWGEEYVDESPNVAVIVRRIRIKIEEDASHPKYIQTVWRLGYRFGD